MLLDSAYVVDPLHPVPPFVSIAAKWLHTQTIDGYEASYDVLYDQVDETIPIYQALIDDYPENAEYVLYLGSTYGIRARVALATKNWLQVIYSGYKGYRYTHMAHEIDPELSDVFMPIGLMEYFSCMASSPVRLAAKVAGITPDCEKGISHLEDAVSGGGYSRIEAANALTYIYLYFLNQPEMALQHVSIISDEHPQNPFFAALKGEALAAAGNWSDLEAFYPHLESLSHKGPFLQKNETQLKVKYIRAIQKFSHNEIEATIDHTTWIINNYHMEFDWLLGKAHLLRGKCYDLLDSRQKAIDDYKKTVKLENYFPDGDIARELVKEPYSRVNNN
jgi:tetratricopeptide (TPR) repeat protein